jgi:hypothetical protein
MGYSINTGLHSVFGYLEPLDQRKKSCFPIKPKSVALLPMAKPMLIYQNNDKTKG